MSKHTGPKIRCFTFRGKRVCREVGKKPKGEKRPTGKKKLIKVGLPITQSERIGKFGTGKIPETQRVGTRIRTVTKETLRRLKKTTPGVKRIRK